MSHRLRKKYSNTLKKPVESVILITLFKGDVKKIEYESVKRGGDGVSTLSSSESESSKCSSECSCSSCESDETTIKNKAWWKKNESGQVPDKPKWTKEDELRWTKGETASPPCKTKNESDWVTDTPKWKHEELRKQEKLRYMRRIKQQQLQAKLKARKLVDK